MRCRGMTKNIKKGYVEAIDYTHAFLEEKVFPPKLHNLFDALK